MSRVRSAPSARRRRCTLGSTEDKGGNGNVGPSNPARLERPRAAPRGRGAGGRHGEPGERRPGGDAGVRRQEPSNGRGGHPPSPRLRRRGVALPRDRHERADVGHGHARRRDRCGPGRRRGPAPAPLFGGSRGREGLDRVAEPRAEADRGDEADALRARQRPGHGRGAHVRWLRRGDRRRGGGLGLLRRVGKDHLPEGGVQRPHPLRRVPQHRPRSRRGGAGP